MSKEAQTLRRLLRWRPTTPCAALSRMVAVAAIIGLMVERGLTDELP
jgi:hypothetical protein